MQKVKSIVLLLIITIFTSCVSKKKIVYFQNDQIDQSKFSNSYKTIFKPDDLLQITISALDIDAVKPFNLPAVSYATTTNSVIGTPRQQLYLVDNDGYIDFPVLGRLQIGGLTRQEAIDLLIEKLDPDYIKSPTIIIRISNFSVTVLGDVKLPGTYTIPNERITILQAVGLAGDLNISGVRNIQVKREENGQIKTYEVDLKSNNLFISPVYYLQQNDIVYVEPNYARSQSASANQNAGLFISIAGVLISIITLISR
ncbi:polysaccharide export outer membrane protein [Tenacibaculum sp. MAR_2009_124]|uniref:polysaccharide biosynthesis/export family protein n=1 Tax=Tenacibaculum sp. MAR_2009_124 TaxID=1250059 RepID=UPI000897B25E|nr:polysaccharide biosynthesis/export family protein [Tenacibaculum sp. MAR_2009_124]SEB70360.1 polysaccharide export outer membrane protein [Tenacibaculum sp. MAR_2009_124]